MVQILFTVFGMGYINENAQIIDNHGTLLHTTVQLKHKELNYHLIMYNLSTILPTFQTPHISQSDNHCPLFEFSGFFIHSKSKHSDGPHLNSER